MADGGRHGFLRSRKAYAPIRQVAFKTDLRKKTNIQKIQFGDRETLKTAVSRSVLFLPGATQCLIYKAAAYSFNRNEAPQNGKTVKDGARGTSF